MNHSSNPINRLVRSSLHMTACVAVSVACGQATTSGPEGTSSGETSSSVTSSSTSTSTTAGTSANSTSSRTSTGTSSQSGTSTGASGQSGTSSGASGQSDTSSGGSGQSGTSSGGSGQSGTSSGGSGGSTSAASDTSTSGIDSESSGGSGSDSSGASESTGGEGSGEFTLTSSMHEDGAEFADDYTCEGKAFADSIIPPLEWTPGPSGTLSYAISFIDTKIQSADPNDSRAYHWAMWNIPGDTFSVEEGMMMPIAPAVQTGKFLGPCPGGMPDTYAMTIYAIPTETLDFSGSGTGAVKMADDKMKSVALDTAVLTGNSSAMSTGF
jgi:phosphatidylethanolamine-binding protein (PEBP) family uncharacterized protein